MPVTILDIAPQKWDDAVSNFVPAETCPEGTELTDVIGHAIDQADTSGLVWLPNALGKLTTHLYNESDDIEYVALRGEAGTLRRAHLVEYTNKPAFTVFREAICVAFRERAIRDTVSITIHDYPTEADHMETHMDLGTMPTPVILGVIGGKQQPNFEAFRLPELGDYLLPTGPGDLIVQTSLHWGKAPGLFHGVLCGPRRSVVAIG